jgi:hypothetical protein
MRFKCKEKPEQKNPKKGDTRKIRKFLLFPRRIKNEIVWLETVLANQGYFVQYGFDGVNEVESIGWETTSYELIETEHMEHL